MFRFIERYIVAMVIAIFVSGMLLVGFANGWGQTTAQLKITADSLRAVTVTADSLYAIALNREGAARCSTWVKTHLDTAGLTAKARYGLTILSEPQDSVYVRLRSLNSVEIQLARRTMEAQALILRMVDDTTAVLRKDRAIQAIGLLENVAIGKF